MHGGGERKEECIYSILALDLGLHSGYLVDRLNSSAYIDGKGGLEAQLTVVLNLSSKKEQATMMQEAQ